MIEFKDFSFKYIKSDKMNIDNLNIKIKRGETILFTGASGSGKTSILRTINGLSPEYFEGGFKGDLKVAHLKIGDSLSEFSKIIGSVFQSPKNQFFHLDSTSELAFSMENMSIAPEKIVSRISQISKEFKAEHLIDKKILDLSGGEKQKLAFMASMMLDADIYVLDEITSNLDLKSIELISDIIKKLKEKGKTIIISEHRIYYLKNLIDRMFIIADGKLIHEFDKEDIEKFDGSQCRTRQLDLKRISINKKTKVNINENYLELKDFSYKVDKKKITVNKSFSRGLIYAIVGENGVGKTTFANALSGFIKSKGFINLNGQILKRKDLVKHTFMVMQDVNYQLFTSSVEKEIKLGSKRLGEFDKIVEKLNLRSLLDKHPNMLSGGEKQRVAIASALMSDKKILILDEPTSGLDFKNMNELSMLLEEISEREIIIFVITHDYEFLCSVADKLIHINKEGMSLELDIKEENKNKILEIMEYEQK